MTLELDWQRIIRFNNTYFPDWKTREIIFISNALAGEVGEVCNAVKHYYGGGTKKSLTGYSEKVDDILKEISDTFIYQVLLVEMLDTKERFRWILNKKIDENEVRMLERLKK